MKVNVLHQTEPWGFDQTIECDNCTILDNGNIVFSRMKNNVSIDFLYMNKDYWKAVRIEEENDNE